MALRSPAGGGAATGTSAAHTTAARLREEILGRNEDGWFLGAEDDLLRRLGISRPTLRQAARILESEQLVSVRRGVGGGMFARLPTSDGVAHVASIYLRSQGATVEDLNHAVSVVGAEIARLAACNSDARQRARLLRWVVDYQARDRADEKRWIMEVVVEFGRRMADIAGSPTLSLFEAVLNELTMAPLGVRVFSVPGRIDTVRTYHRGVAEAIRDGDAATAVAHMQAQLELSAGWVAPKRTRK